ncbi:MAG: hypothetical protein P4L68_10450 [Methylovirgula sp.]|nr:hypothetical protein [Methylovirgula sp.]
MTGIANGNAKAFWVDVEVDANGSRAVLMVKTDLELDQKEDGYDAAKVKALIEDIGRHLADNPYLSSARLVRDFGH